MSKGNYSCNRAVIFEVGLFFCYRYFGTTASQPPQPHLIKLLHNANHNHISTTKTTPLLTTFATTNDIPPSSLQMPPFYHRQQRPHRATSLPTDAGVPCWNGSQCLLQRPRVGADLCNVRSLRVSRKADQKSKRGGASGRSEVGDQTLPTGPIKGAQRQSRE